MLLVLFLILGQWLPNCGAGGVNVGLNKQSSQQILDSFTGGTNNINCLAASEAFFKNQAEVYESDFIYVHLHFPTSGIFCSLTLNFLTRNLNPFPFSFFSLNLFLIE